jgi:hypothetical protein
MGLLGSFADDGNDRENTAKREFFERRNSATA